MKKVGLLKDFCRNAAFLDTDAVRLYLLLLAHAPEDGSGEICQAVIRRSLGKSPSPGALKKICLPLERLRLVKFYNLPTKGRLVYRLPFPE